VGDPRLVGGEHPQGTDVARRLGEDHITGVNEDPGDQVQRLLGSGRHHDVVGVGGDSLQRHHLEDLLAQRGVALP